MTLLVARGTHSWTAAQTATTTTDISTGFDPKVIFFWCTGASSSTDATTNDTVSLRRSFGVAVNDGGTEKRWAVGNSSDHSVGTSNTATIKRTDACVAIPLFAGSGAEGLLDIAAPSAWPANGFRVVVDDQGAVDLRVSWLALGGDDVSGLDAGEFSFGTGTTDLTVNLNSGKVFTPGLVMLVGHNLTASTGNQVGAHASLSVGAMTASGQHAHIAFFNEDAAPTSDTYRYATDLEVFSTIDATGAVTRRASFDSVASGSFTLNRLENTGDIAVFYLALQGPQAAVLASALPSTTLNGTDTQTANFETKAVMTLCHQAAESTQDTAVAEDAVAIGFGVSTTDRGMQGVFEQDNAGNMVIHTIIEYDAINGLVSGSGGVEWLVDIDAMLSTGVRFIIDDASAANNIFLIGLHFGNARPFPKLLGAQQAVMRAATI